MMRKIRLCFYSLLTCTALCLSGCEIRVNWFGKHAYVPWYFVVVPVILILVVAHLCFVLRTYKCPRCGHTFRPRWFEFSSWIHDGGKRVVKCPKCGHKGFCPVDK